MLIVMCSNESELANTYLKIIIANQSRLFLQSLTAGFLGITQFQCTSIQLIREKFNLFDEFKFILFDLDEFTYYLNGHLL